MCAKTKLIKMAEYMTVDVSTVTFQQLDGRGVGIRYNVWNMVQCETHTSILYLFFSE